MRAGAKPQERKAIGYCRVSTEEQSRHGLSLEDQEARIRAYSAAQSLELTEVIADPGVTATKALRARPGGVRLLAALANGATDVIVLKLDRLFRNAADALTTVESWDRSGKALHLLDMGGETLNTRSAMGKMFLTVAAGFAELERNLIAERTASALAYRRANGRAWNHAPYGYRTQGGKLLPVKAEQDVLALIRTWRTNGQTLRAIAEQLNRSGIPAKRTGQWYAASVRSVLRSADRVGAA